MPDQQDMIEAIDTEIEAGPEAGGLVATSHESVEDLQYLADNIEKIVGAHNKIRLVILKLAHPGDWVLFKKQQDDKGKAELGFAGANRIGSTLGVSYLNWEAVKITGHDELGDWYRWEYQCDATFRGRVVRVLGRAGSRDKFFGKAHGSFKPLHDVDEGNCKQAAMRAAKKEGVKDLFGLHHVDPKFLVDNGIKLEEAGGFEFKSQEHQVSETEMITLAVSTTGIHKQGKKKNGQDWTLYIVKSVEGDSFFTFSKTMMETAEQARKTGFMVALSFKKTDNGSNEITAISITASKASNA